MAKYIDSGAFQAALVRKQCGPANQRYTDGWNDCLLRVKSMVSKAPAANVAPVVLGRWDDSGRYTFPGGGTAVRCTECGCALTVSEYRLNNWNYCPICGAKMDGGDNDAAD
nr:MAG TPA: DNA-directed RNA polymerase [Caudoviricetes sp.]